MNQNKSNPRSGYTIIEITIALAFIATLMISVLTVSMQLFSLYNKGVTIRDVNAVTRHLVRDIQDSVAASKTDINLIAEDGTGADSLQTATDKSLDYYTNDHGGRLCTGSYTYIWNYGQEFSDYTPGPTGEDDLTQFVQVGSSNFEAVRFIKVEDDNKSLCRVDPDPSIGLLVAQGKKLPTEVVDNATPVFGEGERDLVLYEFDITSPALLALEQDEDDVQDVTTNYYSNFYTINTIVGSSLFSDEYTIVDDTPDRCKIDPDNDDAMREYCAVNEIEFVARSGQI